jgi:hypothetical protein
LHLGEEGKAYIFAFLAWITGLSTIYTGCLAPSMSHALNEIITVRLLWMFCILRMTSLHIYEWSCYFICNLKEKSV